MKPSPFNNGLTRREISFLQGGINEFTSDKYSQDSTDLAGGVSFRRGSISTDGLGFGRMGFETTGILSGTGRGLGLWQYIDQENFCAVFGSVFDGLYARMKFPAEAIQDSNSVTLEAQVELSSHVAINGLDIETNYVDFRKITSGDVFSALINQPPVPTLDETTPGSLSGYYAYCYTLVDSNGNESLPSPLVASGNLSTIDPIVQIDLNGLEGTIYGWATIRIYRTLTSSAAYAASQNPTFYHVPGLDTAINTATATYDITDSVADSTLTNINNYRLTNVAYADGELKALTTTAVPKFICSFEGRCWGGFWKESSVEYPIRLRFSDAVDNSGTSNGNATSWNKDNYIDVGTLGDGDIIGIFPGLQGRLYIFKENSTYLVQPTGSDIIPYTSIPISNEYGFYHHSVAQTGTSVIGRTKDGLAEFNGASFRHFSKPIVRTLSRTIIPNADSGVYDFDSKRYFLAVCDPTICPVPTTVVEDGGDTFPSILGASRNLVICYDTQTQTFELYPRVPIQVFSKLRDINGKNLIFGLGLCSDIFFITVGNIYGSSYSDIGTIFSNFTLLIPMGQANALVGAEIHIPYTFDPDVASTVFNDYHSRITSITDLGNGTSFLEVADPMPPTGLSALFVAEKGSGIVGSGSTANDLVDDESFVFLKRNVDRYSLSTYNQNTLAVVVTQLTAITVESAGSPSDSGTQLAPVSGSFSPAPTEDNLYALVPFIPNSDQDYRPFVDILLPSVGLGADDDYKKLFTALSLQVQGEGTFVLETYLDGNQSYKYRNQSQKSPDVTTVFTLSDTGKYATKNIPLAAPVGFYARFRIWTIRGLGRFDIQSASFYYRRMHRTAWIQG